MRILHTGDLHLEKGPRFDDTARCLDAMVEDGIAQGVKLWGVGGDLYKTVVGHLMEPEERNFLANLFVRMGATGAVVIVYGNHDMPSDLDELALLEAKHPIIVVDRPIVLRLGVLAGIPGKAMVLALPYPHKRHWLGDVQGTIEEQNQAVEAKLRALFAKWKEAVEEAHRDKIPVVSLIHGTFRGSLVAGGEIMPAGQEIEMQVADLEAVGADYNGGSHIHLCQQMGPRTWYSGSPSRSTFGETDEKGYLVVDVAPGEPPIVNRRRTPARRFCTLKAKWENGALAWEKPEDLERVGNAEVRVQVEYAEEDAATAPLEAIEAEMRTRGAVDVKLQKKPVPRIRVRCEEILTAKTLEDKARAYWGSLNGAAPAPEQQERCLAKLGELQRA